MINRDYVAIANQFAQEAVRDRRGKRHCRWVRMAAARHQKDLKRQRRRDFGYFFEDWYGNDVCDFIEKLPHVEGEWETANIKLEPAQIFILVVVFGWRRKDTGGRRFTTVYIEMARKGAKSTLTAAVSLYCTVCEGEVGPQVYMGATTGDQAKKVFNPAKRMVDLTPDLRAAFGLKSWAQSITCEVNGGYIRPINAKASTQDGHNPQMCVLDELHAHKDRGLYDVMKSAFGARKNPLLWMITTAGFNTEGVCYEQRTLTTKILQGLVEAEHYFGIIFTLDEGDNEFDEAVWVKANPMLGVTPTIESMRSYAIEARESPQANYEFKTKRCNIWTTAKGAWLNTEAWKACGGPVDLDKLVPERCYAGLDLASTEDIAALVFAWDVGGVLYLYPRFYVPESAIDIRTTKNSLPYRVWRDRGFMTVTPGNVTDYEYIERDIRNALATFNIEAIGFDRWNAYDLTNRLIADGAPLVEVRQGPKSFNYPMKDLERRIKSRRLAHGGNPVLAWMASNVVARRDVNENMAPDRNKSHEKIDGIVAALMAMALLLGAPAAESLDPFILEPIRA